MLKSLAISNLAVIAETRIDFESGLNILTGETGAGKSIIIDAINLVLGSRASKDMIRSGETKARVEAFFYVDKEVSDASIIPHPASFVALPPSPMMNFLHPFL